MQSDTHLEDSVGGISMLVTQRPTDCCQMFDALLLGISMSDRSPQIRQIQDTVSFYIIKVWQVNSFSPVSSTLILARLYVEN